MIGVGFDRCGCSQTIGEALGQFSILNFLPLKTKATIVEANALRIDWEEVVPKSELNYIMGNPPFVGFKFANSSQKEDMKNVFASLFVL